MSKKILLDTNAYSAFMMRDESAFNLVTKSRRVYLSVFVIAELYFGFSGGRYEQKNRALLTDFISKPPVRVLHTSLETAELFGHIKNNLKQKGQKIPINDVWIAAHALEIGAQVMTRDRHFERIDGIRIASF